MMRVIAILLYLALLLGPNAASAQTVPPGGPTQAEAQHALEMLEDPQKRAQLIDTLRAIAKAAPSARQSAAAPALALEPNSLGAQLLAQLSGWGDRLVAETAAAADALSDLPLLWRRVERGGANPALQKAVLTAIWQLTLVIGCALLAGWLAGLALRRPLAGLAVYAPGNGVGDDGGGIAATTAPPSARARRLLRRLPFAVARLLLELIPVAVFAGIGNLLAALIADGTTRLVILVLVNAYVAYRVVLALGDMLISPRLGRLRLIYIDDGHADYAIGWLRRIVGVAVFGGAIAEIGLLLSLDPGAYRSLVRLVGLAVAGLLAVLVMRSRHAVAAYIRGSPQIDLVQGGARRWRSWFAGAWHYLALVMITAGWIVWAAGARNGIGGLELLIGTVAVLVAARLIAILLLGLLDRAVQFGRGKADQHPGLQARAVRYQAPARIILIVLVDLAALIVLLEIWGINAFFWFAPGGVGGHLVSALVTIAVAVIAAVAVWEGANATLERRLARLGEAGPAAHAARLRTLLPMLRAALLATILAVVGLTALSQIGVNIAPLLAGAGVVGVAIGFGAQKLVQDVITGMFVLFENAIQVGDVVTVAALTGTVEQLSVRTIWLRGGDGTMHVIPFNAVTTISNASRGIGNASVSVTVPFYEDSDRVAAVLSEIAAEMRQDPEFAPLMLGDLKLLGVDAVKATGVTIAAEIPCTSAGRWRVQREFNRRLQKRFQELGIALGSG